MSRQMGHSSAAIDCCDDVDLLKLGASMRDEAVRLGGRDQHFQKLDGGLDPFRGAFNDAVGQVRIVMLVSPVCGLCLRGAQSVYDAVLEQPPGAALRLFVVWVPVLGATEAHVALATRFVPDARASHFWDGKGIVSRAYRQLLGLVEDAWDVHLLYGPGAGWPTNQPPSPDFWMRQLGSPDAPRAAAPLLEPAEFAARARALVDQPLPGPGASGVTLGRFCL